MPTQSGGALWDLRSIFPPASAPLKCINCTEEDYSSRLCVVYMLPLEAVLEERKKEKNKTF